jgi:Flp pilus assembly protein TadG
MARRRSRRDRRGAALVEFALVVPVFFLMVFGILEFGRAMMVEAALANAARAGARAAAMDGARVSDVTDAVNGSLSCAGLPDVTPTVAPNPPSNAAAGQNVTVTVKVPFSQISWLPTPQWLGSVSLTATSIQRRETSQ